MNDLKEAQAQFGRRKWSSALPPKKFRDPAIRDADARQLLQQQHPADVSTVLETKDMYVVRHTTIPVRANRLADLKRFYDQVLQPLYAMPGFHHAYLLVNTTKVAHTVARILSNIGLQSLRRSCCIE